MEMKHDYDVILGLNSKA